MVSLAVMRYLLLSDIHGNAVALEAVLDHARQRRWEKVLFLGDLVGYYPQPERVTNMLRELEPVACLLGNHDELLLAMAAGHPVPAQPGDIVTRVVARHVEALSSGSIAFLGTFLESACAERWQAVHGALRQRWEYMDTQQSAQANFPLLERPLCFVGHTHVPRVFASIQTGDTELWRNVSFKREQAVYRIPPRAKVIFNPGSVGQPRDGSPLASYAVYDDELSLFEHYRVAYDLTAVQRSVREAGYPEMLASRLAVGR
ncbi:MAG: metallophosphoesterase family protein [Trueperaceae bacterium]